MHEEYGKNGKRSWILLISKCRDSLRRTPENTLSYKRGILRGDEKEPLFTLPLQRQFHLSSGHPAGTPAMYKCYLSCNYLGFYLLKTGVNIIGRAPRLDN
jgi:hypothetical protein